MDKKFVEEWVVPLTSVEDIHEKFKEFYLGKLRSSPWSELGVLQPKTKIIQQLLGRINTEGFLTINYEPAINGGMSEFLSAGYSEPGGYVYRKANVDFFCSKEKLDALVDKCEALPSLTYIAMNIKGGWISNKGREDVNAVTWGVYPIMGIIEHTVVDLASFILWKDDAFATWSRRWAHLYPEGDSSRKWLEEVQNSYFLVKLVENDYIHGDLFAVFADF